jgi:IS30 family transposase
MHPASAANVMQAFKDEVCAITQDAHLRRRQKLGKEDTNGLVSEYLPTGADMSGFGQEKLDPIEYEINNRPRKGLGVAS